MAQPFDMTLQQPTQIFAARHDGRLYVVAANGPLNREVRVFAEDGSVASEHSVGLWRSWGLPPEAMYEVGGRPVLVIAVDLRVHHQVRQWDVLTGTQVGAELTFPEKIGTIGVIHMDERAVVVSGDGGDVRFQKDASIYFHDALDGAAVREPIDVGHPIFSMATVDLADRSLIAMGDYHGTISVFDTTSDGMLWSRSFGLGGVYPMDLLPVGDRVYGVSGGGVVAWNAMTGEQVFDRRATDDTPRLATGFVGDRACVFVGHHLYLDRLDLVTGQPIGARVTSNDTVEAITYARVDGRDIIYVADNGMISQIDAATGETISGWFGAL